MAGSAPTPMCQTKPDPKPKPKRRVLVVKMPIIELPEGESWADRLRNFQSPYDGRLDLNYSEIFSNKAEKFAAEKDLLCRIEEREA